VTSANRSGRPPAATREDLRATFGDRVAVFIVADGPVGEGARSASTVLDLGGDHPRVLRPGPIDHGDLAEVLRGMPPGIESID
jgi:tRNA A37 threonylcarbamoyladenosine synthetase subunit TsaC/SUA5/YrdC